jgi:hypothetical protein
MNQLSLQYRQFIADVMAVYECQEAVQPLQEGFDALNESLGKKLATAALATAALAGHGHANDFSPVPFAHDELKKVYSEQHADENPVNQIKNFAYQLHGDVANNRAVLNTARRVQQQLMDIGTPEALQHAQKIQNVLNTTFPMSFTEKSKVPWNEFITDLRHSIESARDYIEKSGNSAKATACTGGDYEDNLINKAHMLKDKLEKTGDANAKKLASNIQDALHIAFPISFTDEHQNEKWDKMMPELNKAVSAAAQYFNK